MNTVIYDKETGHIRRIIEGPISLAYAHKMEDEGFVNSFSQDEVHWETHYIDPATEEVIPKAPLKYEASFVSMGILLTGLPEGVTVTCDGNTIITDNEPTVITFDIPGTYELRLSGHVKYLDKETEVAIHG